MADTTQQGNQGGKTAQTANTAVEPVAQTVEPVVKTAEPVAQTVEPVVQTAEPAAETAEPVAQTAEPVAQTAEPVVQTAEPVATDNSQAVFSDDKQKTPAWLEKASKSRKGQIGEIDEPVSQEQSEAAFEKFKDVKPSQTELGLNPASWVEVETKDVVDRAEQEAAKKMIAAGYDPATGRRLEDIEKEKEMKKSLNTEPLKATEPAKQEDVSKDKKPKAEGEKKSFFAGVKSMFGASTKKDAKTEGTEKAKKDAKVESKGKVKGKGDAKKIETKKLTPKEKVKQEEQKQFIEAEKVYEQGVASVKDLIAPASFEVEYDRVRMDGLYAQSFYVFAYPRYLNVNWLSPVINFDVTMDISQYIYPTSSGDIMKQLKKKVAQMQSTIRIQAEKGQVRDPAIETALQDAEQLRTEIQRGQEKFFQFALYFTIYGKTKKELEKVSKQLESLLAGKLIMTKKAQLQAEHAFNATLPLCLDEIYTINNMNTSPLSTTFPFTSSDLTSDKGILYGINRHNDSLIIFDRFALENANSVVFAKSGAGKSYAVKLEILRLMMMGTDVIIIDPENEYEELSNTVGGTYLKLSLNSDRRINPFDLPKPIKGEEVNSGDLLRSSIINLHGLFKLMLGDITPEEESILDKALIDVYALKGITMEVEDPSAFEPPTMEDLYQILNSMEGATSLAQRLSQYTEGSYSGIFNKPTNVDLSTGMMVFCIRDLEDALRPTAMYIVLNYIWNQVRSELKKRVLVIDEAWSMMQHDDSAKFLFALVKRARKYYLGVSTITQDVEDFVKSDYGKPIITNSSMQLLLKQAPSAVDSLAKIFNLTEGEKYVLINSGVGQGLFFAGLKHVAVQIIASYSEDKLVTTNPEEVLKKQEEQAAE